MSSRLPAPGQLAARKAALAKANGALANVAFYAGAVEDAEERLRHAIQTMRNSEADLVDVLRPYVSHPDALEEWRAVVGQLPIDDILARSSVRGLGRVTLHRIEKLRRSVAHVLDLEDGTANGCRVESV